MAEVHNLVEDRHVACTAHTRCDITHFQGHRICISKAKAGWSHGVRVKAVGFDEDCDIIHWQEQWADTALHGYMPGRRVEDCGWISLTVESALLTTDPVAMSID